MSFTGKSYSSIQGDEGKKKSLLKDNSWIRSNVNEDKTVEIDTNFGKTVLNRYRSNENLMSPTDKTFKTETKTTSVTGTSGSSVHALTKRFGSQDMLNESRTFGTKSTVKTEPKKSTTTTTTTTTKSFKDGINVTETTTTTKQDGVSPFIKSEIITNKDLPDVKTKSSGQVKTEVISVKSSKDTIDGYKTFTKHEASPTASTVSTTKSIKTYTIEDSTPTKATTIPSQSVKSDTKTEIVTVKTVKDLVDLSVSPVTTTSSSTKTYTFEELSPTKTTTTKSVHSFKSDGKNEVVTVKSTKDSSDVLISPLKTTTSVKSSFVEDVSPSPTSFYSVKTTKSDIPTPITPSHSKPESSREESSTISSKTIRTVYSTSDSLDWNTSPSYTRTSYKESRPSDYLSDSITSRTTTTVYNSPERRVTDKDLCTYCHKNMYTSEKIILEDMNINCHASCFKCQVCNASLGHLKAGDSLWVYRHAIHCQSCFSVTKGKWHR